MAERVALVWDTSDPDNKDRKLVRAIHVSLENAKAQALHDIERGLRVVRIETLDGDKTLWTPDK